MKKIIISILLISVMSVSVSEAVTWAKTDRLCEKFIRIHIIANSDSPFDQGIKMCVRNYIFSKYQKEFSKFESKEETLSFLEQNKDEITESVNSYLKMRNCDYNSVFEITKGDFPEKAYGNIVLPRGKYDAFKIILGKGEGKNFFCVMFPPMCVDNNITTSVSIDDITNKNEKELLSGKIVYKLRILELFK